MSDGWLIAVVGPSGVGKDSVMAGIATRAPGIRPVRRVITRAPDPDGEDHEPMTPDAFSESVARGAFCLHWDAHGLSYGIPAPVLADVRGGANRLANLSRGVLRQAAKVFPRLLVLHITAAPEVLAARLAGRGRESADEIAGRLAQAPRPLPPGLNVVTIVNDGPLDDTVTRALAAIQPVRA
ncbi:phosphonate metabolism protein/1,5-bisphosphokinase (PRPP-forming) PhnN [Thetidibacter halocola]|uniref:Ribose 1,5-bisphosphate phosphokinase PhnN n=1 Tax=Thetidibacter halocola TaxID=2827239 RepID=A0A8J8B8M1_9RHOB|nr:phosphonate metabolism protein/1,5-bisphosphokinase (PRPP-forming) PhnN [Thetidibacter halocola]MBS0124909.1 phosphonate metabolism protein/1,5-bisphosphokinase (PRPP-forming) PhnN [Thetidibacter halocola]